MSISTYAFFLFSLLLSLRIAPSEANISLNIGDDASDNPFQDALCSVFTCTSDGELGMFDYFQDVLNDITDITMIFGGDEDGGNRNRQLRGNN